MLLPTPFGKARGFPYPLHTTAFYQIRIHSPFIIIFPYINFAVKLSLLKVKLSLCLTKHHTVKTYWWSGGIGLRILCLGTRMRWSATRHGRFTPRERALGSHWIRGRVGPRTGMNTVVNRKFTEHAENRNSDHPARSPALHHWTIPALLSWWKCVKL
jgi:hypothetical protein